MLRSIARKVLPWCVRVLYSSKESRKEFIRQVNNETWIGSQMGSGGHSLIHSKPIGNEEMVSIMCVLRGDRTYIGEDSKFKEIDHYNSEWTD